MMGLRGPVPPAQPPQTRTSGEAAALRGPGQRGLGGGCVWREAGGGVQPQGFWMGKQVEGRACGRAVSGSHPSLDSLMLVPI